jgi:hypothetical protein
MLEKSEGMSVRPETLIIYASRIVGWADPISGPEPITAKQQERQERLRVQRNDASRRWKRNHPEKARDSVAQWSKTPKGIVYKREYQRSYKRRQRAEKTEAETTGDPSTSS